MPRALEAEVGPAHSRARHRGSFSPRRSIAHRSTTDRPNESVRVPCLEEPRFFNPRRIAHYAQVGTFPAQLAGRRLASAQKARRPDAPRARWAGSYIGEAAVSLAVALRPRGELPPA